MTDSVFTSENPDPVTELVGEGKKFKDVAALAKGKLESDQFIENLKTEMAELRAQLGGQAELDKLKAELQELKEHREGAARPDTRVALSEADIKALVTKAITDDETSRTATQNIAEANARMIHQFGSLDKAKVVLETKAKELGLSVKTLQGIAQQSPTAFEQIVIGKTEAKQGETFVKGKMSTGGSFDPLNAQTPQEGTWEYFENIKKKQGLAAYFRPAVQNAIHKAVAAGTCLLPA